MARTRSSQPANPRVFGYLVAGIGIQFMNAQYVVWGLSLFHVHSGYWGPFMLLSALSGTVSGAVFVGASNLVKAYQRS